MFMHVREMLSIILGLFIISFNMVFLSGVPIVFEVLNFAGGLVAVVPSLLFFYAGFRKRREMEEQFLVFVEDMTEAIHSGMTLPLALQHISKRNYKALTAHVNRLSSQVDWGIPFPKALSIFAKRTGSHLIRRAVETIIQTYKVGGKIADTMHAIGETLLMLDKVQKERTASVHSQIVTSYIIFFIFILILVILQLFLIPSILPQDLSSITGTVTPLHDVFSRSFTYFIIIQGLFAGLVTGKMAEGSIIAGVKHSIFLIAIGYAIFSLAFQVEVTFV